MASTVSTTVHTFSFSYLLLENRSEQTRATWGLWQSGRFFYDLVDSPFLPSYFFLHQLFPFFSCSSCNHAIVQSRTSLSHRYLMARAKSPITQLPWCMYRTYVDTRMQYFHTRVISDCVGVPDTRRRSNLHASTFSIFFPFCSYRLYTRYASLRLN